MGTRNLNRRERADLDYPVQLLIEPLVHGPDLVGQALRRTAGGQPYLHFHGILYLPGVPFACRFVTACPEARLRPDWPVRLTLRFGDTQEHLVREALRQIVGDQGYVLEDHQPWRLGLRCPWDALMFVRAGTPAQLAGELSRRLGR